MARQHAGSAGPFQTNGKGKPYKVIPKTVDLLKHQGHGKGKGKEVEPSPSGLKEPKELPSAILVDKFAKVRSAEITAFQNAIKLAASQGSTRVFQSLPRHLRRRAASHNPRRVPQRLRSRAAAEIDPSSKIAKLHRIRAKKRAKGNLRGESRTQQLMNRQRDKSWLPTHIYHAKRFRMVDRWGYRLAQTPTLKSFRAAYRASRDRAVVNDTSYFGTIEMDGTREDIKLILGSMVGGPFAGEQYESGGRAVDTDLYHPDSFPMSLIGPVLLLWNSEATVLWVRVHPSIFSETWDALKTALARTSGRKIDVQMRDLREELGSLEIAGPDGGRLLRRIASLCRDEPDYKRSAFSQLADPAHLPTGIIIGSKIYDPRLHFPPPVLRADEPVAPLDGIHRRLQVNPSGDLARSLLWDETTRDAVSGPSQSKADLDHRRHQIATPGTRLRPLATDDRIPILLFASSSTWTLMFPRQWSTPLLQSVAYTATLIGGLDEREARLRETGTLSFPEHYGAVCRSGADCEEQVLREDYRRWSRRPPAKRTPLPNVAFDWTSVLGLSEEDQANGLRPWLFPRHLQRFAYVPDKAVEQFRRERGMASLSEGIHRAGVLHVKLQPAGRGSPARMARLYAAQHDLDKNGPSVPGTLIGYVTTGNFSMSRGHGHALGLVSLEYWTSSVNRSQGTLAVRFRNHGSLTTYDGVLSIAV